MLREYRDSAGTEWKVWEVYPSARSSGARTAVSATDSVAFPKPELADGWLCFESRREKRRLAPIPPGWEMCEPAGLERLCGEAGFISWPADHTR